MRAGRALAVVAAVTTALWSLTMPAAGAAGAEPADPAAARRAITQAFEAFGELSTVEDLEDNLDLIDDPRGVVDAARQAQQNFPYEVSHDHNVVRDIRFTSPTSADVTYDIVIDNGFTFPNRVGQAVLRDGRWRLTRSTVCGNLALAGGSCSFAPDTDDERAIVELFDAIAALTTGDDVAAHLDLIDDPRGVVEAAHQAYANFPYEVTHDSNRVTDIRFVSPTVAEVTFDILIDNGLTFTGRPGKAVLRDGRWKLARETACASLALAGGLCDTLQPPPTTSKPLPGPNTFSIVISAVAPTPPTALARSVTPCPPAGEPHGSTPAEYVVSVTNAPDTRLPLSGGSWETHVDLRKFGTHGTENIEVRASCLLRQGDTVKSTLEYQPVTLTVNLDPLTPPPPAPPAPVVSARPQFTG